MKNETAKSIMLVISAICIGLLLVDVEVQYNRGFKAGLEGQATGDRICASITTASTSPETTTAEFRVIGGYKEGYLLFAGDGVRITFTQSTSSRK